MTHHAIEVFNEAFGGGFSARLIQRAFGRRKDWLMQSAAGSEHDLIIPAFSSMSWNKEPDTVQAIEALDQQIDRLKTKPVTDKEIQRAKDAILNVFVFNFDTPDKVLRERMAYEFYGYRRISGAVSRRR